MNITRKLLLRESSFSYITSLQWHFSQYFFDLMNEWLCLQAANTVSPANLSYLEKQQGRAILLLSLCSERIKAHWGRVTHPKSYNEGGSLRNPLYPILETPFHQVSQPLQVGCLADSMCEGQKYSAGFQKWQEKSPSRFWRNGHQTPWHI